MIDLKHAIEPLLAETDPATLETALAAAEIPVIARAVSAAPTLQHKTDLLWAMEDEQRRKVLRLVPPALIGALVQNLEDDNRYLLGDLGLEQFQALLKLCSPERQYYWVVTALSFTDARANALPLLLPTLQLAEILLTRAEFEAHVKAMADYPLEDQRLPPEMFQDPAQALVDLFGAENLLRLFPVVEPTLAQFLQTLLDYDADRYVDLMRAALARLDYAENHADEWEALTEAPVLLDTLSPPGELDGQTSPGDAYPDGAPVPLALVPLGQSPLARAAATLTPVQRDRLSVELQELFVRQSIAEGGSFLMSDLDRVARSVQAYVLLGLRAELEAGREGDAAVLLRQPLHRVAQNGARLMETLRQVAIRLQPLRRVLDSRQRALIDSVVRPRLTLVEGEPRLGLLPGPGLADHLSLDEAGAALAEVAAWVDLARGLGLDRCEAALKGADTVDVLLEELALGAVLFGKLSLGLAEPTDRNRRLDPATAHQALQRALAGWAPKATIRRDGVGLLGAALNRLLAAWT